MAKIDYSTTGGYNWNFHPRMHAPAKNGFYGYTTLDECYKHPSEAKRYAFRRCKNLCNELNGFNFCINGYNCMAFTVIFDFEHPETGELMRAHITKDYNHLYFL